MIELHQHHSFDLDLIQPGSWAIDVGCRDFGIARLLAANGVNVIACDPDPGMDVPSDLHGNIKFERVAVVKGCDPAPGHVVLSMDKNVEARSTVTGASGIKVPATTIEGLMRKHHVSRLSLLKLDCEGAEYAIMEDIASLAIVDQITVEYHAFRNIRPPDIDWWGRTLETLRESGYEIVQHIPTVPPWGGRPILWDCLYQLKAILP